MNVPFKAFCCQGDRINPANIICIVRVILAFVAIYLLLEVKGTTGNLCASGIIFVAIMLDAVDGMVARWFGFEGEVGKLSDLYADHIVANIFWVSFSSLGLISVWVPLITTTRDMIVDWLRQVYSSATGMNGFQQVDSSRFKWIVSSRFMRAFYAGLKLCSWSGLVLSLFFSVMTPYVQVLIGITVVVCLLRAIPSISVSWRYVVYFWADREKKES